MTLPEDERHIVQPFGRIGGPYEVDADGLRKYKMAQSIAVVFLVIFIPAYSAREMLAIPAWSLWTLAAVCFAATLALCWDVMRKGRKL